MFVDLEDYMLPCFTKKLLGFDCLGCGFQRSLVALVHGDFSTAFTLYPAIYTLLFFVGYIIANFFFKFKNSQKVIRYFAILNIIIIIGSYLLKITH